MIPRDISNIVKKAAKQYPVITLTGPRQSGKTTLCRAIFRDLPYASLEDPETRLYASDDPRGFLAQHPKGAVIDEIQRVPDLVSYIQGLVDEPRSRKLFVLTGSQNLALSRTVSQSLAGRTALFTLLPFSIHELRRTVVRHSVDLLLLSGFFPRIHDKKLNPTQALAAYFETYIERDLRGLSHIHNLSLFQKFVKLSAGRVGQILNLSALGNEAGVTAETARQWMGLLQATYVVSLLQPYYRNFSKRIVKAPKLYFYDVGLASYLLGIATTAQMSRDPLRGALFENMVVMDIQKTLCNAGIFATPYYFRDNNGNEVDLLVEKNRVLHTVEIKASQTMQSDMLKGLRYLGKVAKGLLSKPQVVYGSTTSRTWMGVPIRSYRDCHNLLK